MRVLEIITESRQLQEGPKVDAVAGSIGKAAGSAVRGAQSFAKGASSAWQSLKKGYQAGKAGPSADIPTPNTGDYGPVSKDGKTVWNKKTQQWEPYDQDTTQSTGTAGQSTTGASAPKSVNRSSTTSADTAPAASTPTNTAKSRKITMTSIKSSIEKLPKNQRAQIRKIAAAKAGVN